MGAVDWLRFTWISGPVFLVAGCQFGFDLGFGQAGLLERCFEATAAEPWPADWLEAAPQAAGRLM